MKIASVETIQIFDNKKNNPESVHSYKWEPNTSDNEFMKKVRLCRRNIQLDLNIRDLSAHLLIIDYANKQLEDKHKNRRLNNN